jgi:hypothetical protein
VQPEQPAEQPAEPTVQPETPAEQPAEPAVEPETPAEQPEPAAAEPVETPEAGCAGTGEMPEGAEATAEDATEEPVEGTGESACGGLGIAEGCGTEPCGWTETTGEEPAGDETAAVAGEERVVWVAGQMVHLPRLPFFGCEDVTDDDLRAIIEDVVRNPETDE